MSVAVDSGVSLKKEVPVASVRSGSLGTDSSTDWRADMQDLTRRMGAIRTSAIILDVMSRHVATMDPEAEGELVQNLLDAISLMLLLRGPKSTPDTPRPSPATSTTTPDLPF